MRLQSSRKELLIRGSLERCLIIAPGTFDGSGARITKEVLPARDHDEGGVWERRGFARRGRVDHSKPFNIASYSLLTMMVARATGLEPREFVHTLGDAHLYLNHLEQADTQLGREPFPLPRMELNPGVESIFDFAYGDFRLAGYEHHPAIRAPIAV